MGSSVVGTPLVHRALAALAGLLTLAAVAMTAVQVATPTPPPPPVAAPPRDPEAELAALRARIAAIHREFAAVALRDARREMVVARVATTVFGDLLVDEFELTPTHAVWQVPAAGPRGVAIDPSLRRRMADALARSAIGPLDLEATYLVIGDARVDVASPAGVALTAVLAELEARAYADLAAAYVDAVALIDVPGDAGVHHYRVDRAGLAERRAGRWDVIDADPRRAVDLLDDVFARAVRRAGPERFARVTLTRAGRVTRGELATPPPASAAARLR